MQKEQQQGLTRRVITVILIIVSAVALLFFIGQIKVWRTLEYGCLLNDEALEDDLACLVGQKVSIRSTYGVWQTITVGYRGCVESANSVLRELSSAGGLVWREYAAGSRYDQRVEAKNFRVKEICAFLPLWFPVWKLDGACDVRIGLE